MQHMIKFSKKMRLILAVASLFLIIGTASAAVLTIFYANGTATVKTPDILLVAGSDNTGSSVYPSATVNVASTKDYANIAFSLFPSATNTPQPATYYTDMLQIKNNGTADHTIKSLTITNLSGASSLGNLTIYYFGAQTDSPSTGTPIGSVNLSSGSTAPVTIFSGTQTISAADTDYIEIVGYAAPGASVGATISFTVAIQWA